MQPFAVVLRESVRCSAINEATLTNVHVTWHVNCCSGRHYIIVVLWLVSHSVMWTQYAGFKQSYILALCYVIVDERMIGSGTIGNGVMNWKERGSARRGCGKERARRREGWAQSGQSEISISLTAVCMHSSSWLSTCTPSQTVFFDSLGLCAFTLTFHNFHAQVRWFTCDACLSACVHVWLCAAVTDFKKLKRSLLPTSTLLTVVNIWHMRPWDVNFHNKEESKWSFFYCIYQSCILINKKGLCCFCILQDIGKSFCCVCPVLFRTLKCKLGMGCSINGFVSYIRIHKGFVWP